MNTSRNNYTQLRPYLAVYLLIFLFPGLISCGSDSPISTDDTVEVPEHARLLINTPRGNLDAQGPGVESTWDSELGIVSITMDESLDGTLDLYGSLNLIMGNKMTYSDGLEYFPVKTAIISTSDCLICEPGEAINGKFYSLVDPNNVDSTKTCDHVQYAGSTVTESFIEVREGRGALCLDMVDRDGNQFRASGGFIAIDENSR